jgi:hypothetical protein
VTTISFTAARLGFSPPPSFVENVLADRIPLAKRYVTGACEGGDAYIGAWLYRNRPDAEHVVVVPANRIQADYWWKEPGTPAGPTLIVVEMLPGSSYADRNQELVDRADWVVGFPAFPEGDSRSQRSGTWQTIRMARQARKLSQWHCVMPPYAGQVEQGL